MSNGTNQSSTRVSPNSLEPAGGNRVQELRVNIVAMRIDHPHSRDAESTRDRWERLLVPELAMLRMPLAERDAPPRVTACSDVRSLLVRIALNAPAARRPAGLNLVEPAAEL